MIPVRDVIPTRTRPVVTLVTLAAMIAALAWPGVRAWWLPWAANGLLFWLTGSTLEDRFGRARFAGFAAACAAAAGAALLAAGHAPEPVWAAAGVAAGTAAAYLVMFPTSRVQMLVPVIIGVEVAEVPAWAIALVWLAVQMVAAWSEPPGFAAPAAAALAAAAAAGGAVGALAGLVLPCPERMRVEWWDPK